MPNRTVVRRSTSRISSAVSAFIEDALPFPLRAALKKTKDLFDVNARIHRVRKTAHEYHPAQGQGSVFPQNSKTMQFLGQRPRSALHNIQPPLTFTTCPVMYSASSDAKNATAAATSSTVGGRPIG